MTSSAGLSGLALFQASIIACSRSLEEPGWLDQNWMVPVPSSPWEPEPPPAQAASVAVTVLAPARVRKSRRLSAMVMVSFV